MSEQQPRRIEPIGRLDPAYERVSQSIDARLRVHEQAIHSHDNECVAGIKGDLLQYVSNNAAKVTYPSRITIRGWESLSFGKITFQRALHWDPNTGEAFWVNKFEGEEVPRTFLGDAEWLHSIHEITSGIRNFTENALAEQKESTSEITSPIPQNK